MLRVSTRGVVGACCHSPIDPCPCFGDQVRCTCTQVQSRGSDLAPSTLLYGDGRDATLRQRFGVAVARAREAGSQACALVLPTPEGVLGHEAPVPLSKTMLTLLLSDVLTNTMLARNDNPDALAEVEGSVLFSRCVTASLRTPSEPSAAVTLITPGSANRTALFFVLPAPQRGSRAYVYLFVSLLHSTR